MTSLVDTCTGASPDAPPPPPPPEGLTESRSPGTMDARDETFERSISAIRIEIERALAESDAALAVQLQGQLENLQKFGVGSRTLPLSQTSSEMEGGPCSGEEAPRPIDDHCGRVTASLLVGDLTAAVEPDLIAAYGVTHIVDLAQTIDEHTPTGPEGRNCHYEIPKSRGSWAASMPRLESKLVVRVDDTEDAPLAEHFAAINDFVSQAIGQGGHVLVHCFRGKSRSCTSVAQFLMRPQGGGLTLREALGRVKCARPAMQLNDGFKKLLMALEAELRPNEPPSFEFKPGKGRPKLSSDARPRSRHRAPSAHTPPPLPAAAPEPPAPAAH